MSDAARISGKPGLLAQIRDFSGPGTAAVLIIFFLLMDVAFVRSYRRYAGVENWREIQAQVSLQRRDYFEENNGRNGRRVSHKIWIDADYLYAVDGKTYRGHTVSARGSISKHPIEGTPDHAYYNPSHPEDAVLIREPQESAWVIFALGSLTAMPIYLGIISVRDTRRARRRALLQKKSQQLRHTG